MVGSVVCSGNTYFHHGLVGYGLIASNARDKYGDTLRGVGSSAVVDQSTWKKTGDSVYEGIAWCLPDRGW